MKIIHTADWQIGKPFAGIEDDYKRALVRKERIDAVGRIADVAREEGAGLVLVAGDLFDSPSADKATVAEASSAIGRIGAPVVVIPGNHDHGGPGSVWEQDFFRRESSRLAPNLTVLLGTAPLELDEVVLFPCPLLRRLEAGDRTDWLRDPALFQNLSPSKARVVLAHGSVHGFAGGGDDEEADGTEPNRLDLARLPMEEIDYVALGDWHGAKQVGPKAWYSGTPESDRFRKGEEQKPGHILLVEPRRGAMPGVRMIPTGRLRWSEISFEFADDGGVAHLADRLDELVGSGHKVAGARLSRVGSRGLVAWRGVVPLIYSLRARLLRLKIDDRTTIAPTDREVEELTLQAGDPLIATVARRLVAMARSAGDEGEIAAVALRELHAACRQEGGA